MDKKSSVLALMELKVGVIKNFLPWLVDLLNEYSDYTSDTLKADTLRV